MMRSISLFCGAENSCAVTGSASIVSAAALAPISVFIMQVMLGSSLPFLLSWISRRGISRYRAALRRLVARDVVRLDPTRRSYGKTSFGATRKLPGCRQISAIEGCLGGGEVRICKVTFAAVSHCQLLIGIRYLRIARERLAQIRYRLIDQSRFIGSDQSLTKQHMNEGRVWCKRDGVAQRCNGIVRPTGIDQSLALEFEEVRIVGLDLDQ